MAAKLRGIQILSRYQNHKRKGGFLGETTGDWDNLNRMNRQAAESVG
jgi:hypothetical protein